MSNPESGHPGVGGQRPRSGLRRRGRGGRATGLSLTQVRPERIRITEDVDIIAQVLTARDYHAIEDKVRARGFSNDMRPGAPICRWVYGTVTVDVMPTVQILVCQPLVPAGGNRHTSGAGVGLEYSSHHGAGVRCHQAGSLQ